MFFRMQPVLLVLQREHTDKEAADMFDNLMSDVAMGNAEPADACQQLQDYYTENVWAE